MGGACCPEGPERDRRRGARVDDERVMTAFRTFQRATINATFAAAVEAHPERVYLDFSGDRFTYRRMASEIERLARGLHVLGVTRGDRVVTLLENSPDALIAW